MTERLESEREYFYRERDSRTTEYVEDESFVFSPVSVHVSADACETRSGQLLVQTLVNQLARIHRELKFFVAAPDAKLLTHTLSANTTLGDEIVGLARRIDPFGTIDVEADSTHNEKISLGIGAYCRPGLSWYLGFDRSNAILAKQPCQIGTNVEADLRGAGLSAILGAVVATKAALNLESVPTTISAWNYKNGVNAKPGPAMLPPIEIGRGLMIGAGAVAAATVYWLIQWGNESHWTLIDKDKIELHNTNRGLLFFPEDAGWLGSSSISKASCLCAHLSNSVSVDAWYDEAAESKLTYDTILVLANERDVRSIVSARNDPIQLQATTGRSWLSQLHRHIVGVDDCVRCRMGDIHSPQLSCGIVPTASAEKSVSSDAALPFLSAASGLMLVSALQHLQLGDIAEGLSNMWNWDFQSKQHIAQASRSFCRKECTTKLSSHARRQIAHDTCWRDSSWLS